MFLATAQAIPAAAAFFSGKNPSIASFSVFEYFNSVFGITHTPIAYQFWFIRDLFILVLIVPLITILNAYVPRPFLVGALAYWLAGEWQIFAPASDALFFFSVGAFLASRKRSLFQFDRFGTLNLALYSVLVILDVLTIGQHYNPYLHKVGILFGVFVALFLSKRIARSQKIAAILVRLSGASFFVYAVHEPSLTVLRKLLFKLMPPGSSFAVLTLYFLAPTLTILMAVAAYRSFARIAPGFVRSVTGGR